MVAEVGVTPPVLGVDVGGTKVLGRALTPDGAVLSTARRDTPVGADAIERVVRQVVLELRAGLDTAPDALGIGIAGLVDRGGVLRFAPNLPGVSGLDLAAALDDLGLAVHVENDATAALWGEVRLGAARGAADAVLVTLGTGIGGGILAEGRLVRGWSGLAGEPGHMMVDPAGPPCPCGRRGCWERFASGSGLGRLARDAVEAGRAPALVDRAGGDVASVRGEHVTAAAADGDPAARAILEDFAWWIAVGLANVVDLCDPEVVVVGGGLVDAGDLLLDPVRAAYADLVLGHGHRREPRIVAAALGSAAAAVGAALLAATGDSRFGSGGAAQ